MKPWRAQVREAADPRRRQPAGSPWISGGCWGRFALRTSLASARAAETLASHRLGGVGAAHWRLQGTLEALPRDSRAPRVPSDGHASPPSCGIEAQDETYFHWEK